MEFEFNDVNRAYPIMMGTVNLQGIWEHTRNGRAKVLPEPVLIHHRNPQCRVLYDALRNANPFFHYMEALWILGGRNDLDFIGQFASNLKNYSDDGETLHGAYGWRIADQLLDVIQILANNPESRRAVVQLWFEDMDLNSDSKDLPCNTHLYFRVLGSTLDMTVCNRSNDLVWGMLGANIVHFSIIQEYVASALHLQVGTLHQFSNNVHVYEDWMEGKVEVWKPQQYPVGPRIAFGPSTLNFNELDEFLRGKVEKFHCPILRDNAVPMLKAWESRSEADAEKIHDLDWRIACVQWILRRQK